MYLGIICALIAALMATGSAIVAQELLSQTNLFMIGFARQAVSLILVIPYFLYRFRESRIQELDRRKTTLIFVRSLFSALSTAAIFLGLLFVSLTDTVLLSKTSPLFAGLISWLTIRKKLELMTWVGIGVSFIGIVVIIHPSGDVFRWGSLIALSSGFLAACSYIIIRRLGKDFPSLTLFFLYCFFTTILWALPLPWTWITPSTAEQWILLVVIGVFATAFQAFLTVAYSKARVTLVSTLLYTAVIYAALWEALVSHHIPGWIKILGMLLVLAGGILIVWAQRDSAKRTSDNT